MVRMHFGASYNTLAIDKKPCGQRKFPAVVAIESLEIDAETRVQLLKFFRQGEVQTEFISIFVILIRQYWKSESMLFHDLFCILVQLGGNGDD